MKHTNWFFGKYGILVLFSLPLTIATQSCDDNPYKHGAIMYSNFCASCHMEDGTGLGAEIPPLAQADYLKNNPDKIVCIIRNGLNEEIVVNGKTYKQPMEGNRKLSDAEITNIINYINTSWGNDLPLITIATVRKQMEACP